MDVAAALEHPREVEARLGIERRARADRAVLAGRQLQLALLLIGPGGAQQTMIAQGHVLLGQRRELLGRRGGVSEVQRALRHQEADRERGLLLGEELARAAIAASIVLRPGPGQRPLGEVRGELLQPERHLIELRARGLRGGRGQQILELLLREHLVSSPLLGRSLRPHRPPAQHAHARHQHHPTQSDHATTRP
jgi:hypothetical protein